MNRSPTTTAVVQARYGRPHGGLREPSRAASLRQPALDGLRGLAILATLLLHYELRSWPYRSGVFFPAWFVIQHGWLGVEGFFVLSGFLITGILFDAKEQPHYWRNYYARRTLRIFPLYYLALAMVFLVLPRVGGAALGAPAVAPGTQLWFWTYTQNVLIALKGYGASPPYTPHFWTLAIEEQFYLVWPLVVFFCGRRSLLVTSLAVSVLSLALRVALFSATGDYVHAGMLAPTHLDGLALGAFAAILVRGARPAETFRTLAMRLMLGFAGVLAVMELVRGRAATDDFVIGTVGVWFWSALFACLVLVAATSKPTDLTQRLFALRPLQAVGRLCYGMYVWHYMLLVALTSSGFTIAALETRFASTWRAHAAFLLVNSLGTLVLALISWHLCEKQFLKLKQFFPYANDFAASSRLSGAGGRRAVTAAGPGASPLDVGAA